MSLTGDLLRYYGMMSKDPIGEEIKRRTSNAKLLAKKFPELKGLTYKEFLRQLPIDLDFVTSSEMYEELNKEDEEKEKI